MTSHKLVIAILILLATVARPALAVEPEEMLANPALEARARAVSRELRCVVCQNQSIDDSNADIARDMRVLVRERIEKGDTDEQAMAFLVARYGNYVRLRPPMQADTLVLWLSPLLFLGLAAALLRSYFRTMRTTGSNPVPLNATEKETLQRLVGEG